MLQYDAWQFGARGRQLHNKKYTTITGGTYKTEDILEGESLQIGILGVGGHHGDARERTTVPHRAECSFLVGIEFIAF